MSPLTVHIFQTKSLIKTEPCNPYQSVSPLPSPIFSVLPSHVDLVTESGPVSYLKYVLPLPFLLPMTLLYFGFLIFCSLIIASYLVYLLFILSLSNSLFTHASTRRTSFRQEAKSILLSSFCFPFS